MSINWPALKQHAEAVRANAHAPYSNYQVGAALLSSDGRVFVGANVENASYGLCLCAERSAVAAAVSAGVRSFAAIAIATRGPKPASPCGMCRQVLSEFVPSFEVLCFVAGTDAELKTTVAELLPHSFDLSYLAK